MNGVNTNFSSLFHPQKDVNETQNINVQDNKDNQDKIEKTPFINSVFSCAAYQA